MRHILLSLLCIAFAGTVGGAAESATNRYVFRAEHSRDGIGKFYMGREIAHFMSHQGADWLERPEREEEEHTSKLVAQLGIKRGDVIADIGAGTGYFSRRLATNTGPSGRVFAVEIQTEMLDLLTNQTARAGITNVVPVLGTISDPKLPASSVDLAIMVDVYHEFEHPWEMMRAIVGALKPGGRVVFIEFRGEDPAVPIKPLHKMTEAQLKKEMSDQALEWIETIGVLPRQHIVAFRKTNGAKRDASSPGIRD